VVAVAHLPGDIETPLAWVLAECLFPVVPAREGLQLVVYRTYTFCHCLPLVIVTV
jgi:hypothetical protein